MTSEGTSEIGHGGGGVFSISGSACGIFRFANEAINSGVDKGFSSSRVTDEDPGMVTGA